MSFLGGVYISRHPRSRDECLAVATLSMARRASPAKNYCFTINNPTLDDLERLQRTGAHMRECGFAYLVYQHEVGANGTFHIQGYCSLTKKRRMDNALLRAQLPRAALTVARGSPADNKAYCTKGDSRADRASYLANYYGDASLAPADVAATDCGLLVGPFEHGSPPAGQGRRTDLVEAGNFLKEGGSLRQLALDFTGTYVHNSRGLTSLKFQVDAVRGKQDRDLEVMVFTGPTGSGKTHAALQYCRAQGDGNDWFLLSHEGSGTMWFDGYEGESILVLDEFRGSWCKYSWLLRVLDKYPLRLPIKGGHTWALWTKVIITTTHPWQTWYDVADTATGELQRRLHWLVSFEDRREVSRVAIPAPALVPPAAAPPPPAGRGEPGVVPGSEVEGSIAPQPRNHRVFDARDAEAIRLLRGVAHDIGPRAFRTFAGFPGGGQSMAEYAESARWRPRD